MRIAVIHSFYRSAVSSGENNTVLAQVEALRGAGHEVELIAQYTDENRKRNPLYPLKAGFDVATGNGYDPTPELEKFQPDVVRVHNLFPNFGTKWLENWKGPVMATLHNYRPVCANGVLFRDGAICTLCPDGKPLSSLKYGCYRNSRLASVPLTIQISKGLNANPLIARADKLVVLSKRSFEAYQRFGVHPSRMEIVTNFVNECAHKELRGEHNGRWILSARISPEKGVRELIEIWPKGIPLDIYGSGDSEVGIRDAARGKREIRLMGKKSHAELMELLPQYEGAVFSSLWWETFGRFSAEAMMAGLPVLALRGSSAADEVKKSGAGEVFEIHPHNLEVALQRVHSNRVQLSRLARTYSLNTYSQTTWLRRTNAILTSLGS